MCSHLTLLAPQASPKAHATGGCPCAPLPILPAPVRARDRRSGGSKQRGGHGDAFEVAVATSLPRPFSQATLTEALVCTERGREDLRGGKAKCRRRSGSENHGHADAVQLEGASGCAVWWCTGAQGGRRCVHTRGTTLVPRPSSSPCVSGISMLQALRVAQPGTWHNTRTALHG